MNRDDVIEAMHAAICGHQCDGVLDPDCVGNSNCLCKRDAILALSALEAIGIALVPVEPDAKMLWCGASTYDHPSCYMGGPSMRGQRTSAKIWGSMLLASPLRKTEGGEG